MNTIKQSFEVSSIEKMNEKLVKMRAQGWKLSYWRPSNKLSQWVAYVVIEKTEAGLPDNL